MYIGCKQKIAVFPLTRPTLTFCADPAVFIATKNKIKNIHMSTDPRLFKRKVGNDFKTTITATMIFKLTFVSLLIVFNFTACLFLVLITDYIAFFSLIPIFNKKKLMKYKKIFRPTDPTPSSAC